MHVPHARSPWPQIKKAKVACPAEFGRMAPAGVHLVEASQAKGGWTAYDDIEDRAIPDHVSSALRETSPAKPTSQVSRPHQPDNQSPQRARPRAVAPPGSALVMRDSTQAVCELRLCAIQDNAQ